MNNWDCSLAKLTHQKTIRVKFSEVELLSQREWNFFFFLNLIHIFKSLF